MSSFDPIPTAVSALCKAVLEKPDLEIDVSLSLTQGLGFDSMHLMQFFAGIEALYPSVVLEDWFMAHASGGRDTLASVIEHIIRATAFVTQKEAA